MPLSKEKNRDRMRLLRAKRVSIVQPKRQTVQPNPENDPRFNPLLRGSQPLPNSPVGVSQVLSLVDTALSLFFLEEQDNQ